MGFKVIYTYCVIDSGDKLKGRIKGLDGAIIYNIPHRDIGLISSEIGRGITDTGKTDVLRHEEVVEREMGNYVVLPMRFNTVFNTRDDAVCILKKHYGEFKENINRLRDKVEFGVRVIWPGEVIKENIAHAHKGSTAGSGASGDTPAKRYMKEKLAEHEIEKAFEKEAEQHILALESVLKDCISEKKVEKLKSCDLLLDANYLVKKGAAGDFREAFEHFKKEHSDFKYLFSGPWPPYNFVRVKIPPHPPF
ncbi:MAG: GvpL/GvpF family gas vesicle protein [Candidatus Aureabacteria bacterium]|nr:GvpL/GvpF family gas vesicle protein [Candidatus Auribacterota bacterium]